MASSDPVAELDRLLLDDPHAEGLDALMSVAGDLLQSRGQLRGEHIALEQAARRGQVRGGQRATASAARYKLWLGEHEQRLFGSLAPLRHRPGAMRAVFRGGRLRSLTLDLRRVVRPGIDLGLRELLDLLLAAPTLRGLCELRIRVRHERDDPEVFEAIRRGARHLPLEVLVISPTTRPLGHQVRGHAAQLRKHFPHLWLVTRFGRITPLIDPELPDTTVAHALAGFADAPMSRELRIRIGRGLSCGREHGTRAACELLAGLGPSARVFVPSLDLLLRPKVSHAAAWILPVIPRLGSWAAPLHRRVRSMTGHPHRYPDKLRRLAGEVAARFAETPL